MGLNLLVTAVVVSANLFLGFLSQRVLFVDENGTIKATNLTEMEFNMQQFLILLKPTRLEMITKGPTQRESQVIDEHFAYLEKYIPQ